MRYKITSKSLAMLNADQTLRPLTSSNKGVLVRVPSALSSEVDLSKGVCVQ